MSANSKIYAFPKELTISKNPKIVVHNKNPSLEVLNDNTKYSKEKQANDKSIQVLVLKNFKL